MLQQSDRYAVFGQSFRQRLDCYVMVIGHNPLQGNPLLYLTMLQQLNRYAVKSCAILIKATQPVGLQVL